MDPNHLATFIPLTTIEYVESQPEYVLAKSICDAVQAAHVYVSERPRWASWHDQIQRSASSVLLNFSEAMGRGRGYTLNSLMIARGELYETAASLAIGPEEVCVPLRPKAKELISILNKRIIEFVDPLSIA